MENKMMELEDLVYGIMRDKYSYNGLRVKNTYNDEMYIAGISKVGFTGKTYTPLKLLDKNYNTMGKDTRWVESDSLFTDNYIIMDGSYKVSLFEKRCENNSSQTIMRVICNIGDTKTAIQYNLTKLTMYLYCILKQYEKQPDITPDKVKFDLFDLGDTKYCESYTVDNKDNSNIVPIWPNTDDYIQTYEENIYDDCSYSYSLSEILKKWWAMYKNVEMNNLKYMYDKYNVSKLFNPVDDETLETEFYYIFASSFKVLYHAGGIITYGANNYTSLNLRDNSKIYYLDFEEYMDTNLRGNKICEYTEKFIGYDNNSLSPVLAHDLRDYFSKNNYNSKYEDMSNDKDFKVIVDAINVILRGDLCSARMKHLLNNILKINPYLANKLSSTSIDISYVINPIDKQANKIYDGYVPYSLRDGNTVIVYLNYNTPIFCRFNITSIIEVEKDFKNCDNIIDAIQTAIDSNVIDKNNLPLHIKIYYK